jgi:dTDP-glucose 4,6-dehydratase
MPQFEKTYITHRLIVQIAYMRDFKKILVTGGAGFIGSYFVDLCLSKEISVVNCDALKTGSMLEFGIDRKHDLYHFSQIDIANPDLVIPDDVDAIVHFAAETHVDRSVSDPFSFVSSNVVGTYNLLNKIIGKNIWFHLISTDEVYGDVIDKSEASKETDSIHSSSPYSATKASSEQLVISYGRTYGVKYTITRGCNTVGGRQNKEKLLPKFIDNAQNNLPLPVYGDGKAVRQYIHATDHALAVMKVLTEADSDSVWNVCADVSYSINDIVEILREQFPNLTITDRENRPGHDLKYNIDNSKLKNILGWQPLVKGKEIILKSITELC